MPVVEIPLSSVGLLSIEEAAARRRWSARTVQRWVRDGLLPAVVAGSGANRTVYLLRSKDVDAFDPPARGRRPGSAA